MYIGSGVFLLVLGAILNWGVSDRISGVDLHLIAIVCMAGGALAILLSVLAGSRARGYPATSTSPVLTATGATVEGVEVDRA